DRARPDAQSGPAEVGLRAGVAIVTAGPVGEGAMLAARDRVAGVFRARVAVVAVGGSTGDAGTGHALVVHAAARSVLAGRPVGHGRRRARTARGVAAPRLVARVGRGTDDRIAAHAGAGLARVTPRRQVSSTVQNCPSSHAMPSAAGLVPPRGAGALAPTVRRLPPAV